MRPEFYLHEDDWGMISLEPEENRFERAKIMGQARAFGEASRAPGGAGWTDLMVVPAPPIALASRAIPLAALCDVLGPACRRYERMTTGYSSHREPVVSGYAFACAAHASWDVVYGSVRGDVVTQLSVTHCTAASAEVLHRLGTAFRLILCDLWRDEVIELASRVAIDRYVADGSEADDE
jgi:hypothetical protein